MDEPTNPSVPPSPASQPPAREGLEVLIPYKNGSALASYYLGVFGLIPLLGLPLSVLAVVFGHKGLRDFKAHPDKHGRTHALVGLILGYFELAVFAAFLVLLYLAKRSSH